MFNLDVNCSAEPPEKPGTGTWEWDETHDYDAVVTYTCGPYGNFQNDLGETYKYLESVCSWNRSWTPSELDPCVATSCQVIPFPPRDIGLQHMEDPMNPIIIESEFTIYNPKIPMTMNFPKTFCSNNGDVMMVVGSISRVDNLASSNCQHFSVFRKAEETCTLCLVKTTPMKPTISISTSGTTLLPGGA